MKLFEVNLLVPTLLWRLAVKILNLTEFAGNDEERFGIINHPKVALSEEANPAQRWTFLQFVTVWYTALLWIPTFISIPIMWLLFGQEFGILTLIAFSIFVLVTALWLDLRILPAYFTSRRWEKDDENDEDAKAKPKEVLYTADYVFSVALGLALSIWVFVVGLPHAY